MSPNKIRPQIDGNSDSLELLLLFDLDLKCENIRFHCKLHTAYRPSVIALTSHVRRFVSTIQ